jgi:regulator of nucleoside diphosphate kinase
MNRQARAAPIATSSKRPPIVLSRSDRAILERAAIEGLLHAPRVAGGLLDEVHRAHVVSDDELDRDVVRIGSLVTFDEEQKGRRTIRLLGPDQSCRDAQDKSVLTSIGAALIGLRVGQSILWPDRVGGEQILTIVSVRQPAVDRRADSA